MPIRGYTMKHFFWTPTLLFLSIFFLLPPTVHAQESIIDAPTFKAEYPKFPAKVRPKDPRFFGTFCDAEPIKRCESGIPLPFGWGEVCVTLKNVRARIDYVDTSNGRLVGGGGQLTVDGNDTTFVMTGVADTSDSIQSSGRAVGYGEYSGPVLISSDGMEATVHVKNKEIPLRKDACGNRPPSASILSPTEGQVLTYGEYFPFTANIADEDETFPPVRAFFESDKDGVLAGKTFPLSHPNSFEVTVFNNNLSPGEHRITFTTIDSGGLSASTSRIISVTNDPPDRPEVMLESSGEEPTRVITGGAVLLDGKAFDPEEGFLEGESLTWRASLNGGHPVVLGRGKRLVTQFKEPGEAVIMLTAVDRAGLETTSVQRRIIVDPFNGNTHPRVAIEMPDQSMSRGPLAAVLYPGAVDFRAIAEDTEDPVKDLKLRWHFEAVRPASAFAPADATGSAAAKVSLTPAVDTIYRVTFSAKDTSGLVGEARINILVLAQPIE